jgi:hypothetical protein
MKQSNALLIRRVIAILLMACTILFLFWPSFLCERSEYEQYGNKNSYTLRITFSGIRANMTENIDQLFKAFGEDTELTINAILAIFTNVAFFGLIAFAGMAIILMTFNRSKAATVLHTILAFFTVLVFVAYFVYYLITYAEEMKDYGVKEIVYPGAGAILLLLCSLAASILYKRDKSYAGALPKRTAQQPVFAPAGVPQQPVNAYVPQQQPIRTAPVATAPAEWICASCTAKNDPSEPFCPYCGAPNPAPVVKQPVARFCTNCGAKQEPDASFCTSCGAKLN